MPAVEALTRCAALVNLQSLSLGHCHLEDAAVEILAGSPWLANLTHLDLSFNKIGPEGAAAPPLWPNRPT